MCACRALAEPYKLLLAMRMAACVQAEAGCLDGAEWQYLLTSSPELIPQPEPSNVASGSLLGGLPESAWAQIKGLERLAYFQVRMHMLSCKPHSLTSPKCALPAES